MGSLIRHKSGVYYSTLELRRQGILGEASVRKAGWRHTRIAFPSPSMKSRSRNRSRLRCARPIPGLREDEFRTENSARL